jgi:hypothetical protein
VGNFCSLHPGMTKAQVEAVMGKTPLSSPLGSQYKLTDGDHLTVLVGYDATGIINVANTADGETSYKVLCGA